MSVSHKPEGYSTVSPYPIVDRANETIDFLVEALDVVELRHFESDLDRCSTPRSGSTTAS